MPDGSYCAEGGERCGLLSDCAVCGSCWACCPCLEETWKKTDGATKAGSAASVAGSKRRRTARVRES